MLDIVTDNNSFRDTGYTHNKKVAVYLFVTITRRFVILC